MLKTISAIVNDSHTLRMEESLDVSPGTRVMVSLQIVSEDSSYDERLEEYYRTEGAAARAAELELLSELQNADVPLKDEGNWW